MESNGAGPLSCGVSGFIEFGGGYYYGDSAPGDFAKGRGQAPVSAPTPELLMQRNLGWSLPIPSLWYWARGLPAPGGNLIYLQQNGWRTNFSDYHTVNGVDLPSVIELQRANILARIVIKQWQIHSR